MTTPEFKEKLSEHGVLRAPPEDTIPDWVEQEAGTGTYSVDELKDRLDKERESWV